MVRVVRVRMLAMVVRELLVVVVVRMRVVRVRVMVVREVVVVALVPGHSSLFCPGLVGSPDPS